MGTGDGPVRFRTVSPTGWSSVPRGRAGGGGGAWGPSGLTVIPVAAAPGPCDYEDLLDGVIFAAKYLGSTQLLSQRNPPPSARMAQAQEAVDRVKVRPRRATGLPRVAGQGGGRLGGQWPGPRGPPRPPCPQAPDGETQPMTDVDLFVSTKRVKVLTADSQVGAGPASGQGWGGSAGTSQPAQAPCRPCRRP